MRKISIFIFLALPAWGQQVGQVLSQWTPGTLDIHHINTGRGNSALLIFPDGTSMLLDAGDGGRLPPRGTPPKPDASRKPGEWIARYVQHMLGSEAALDYAYLTHFHDDHMGGLEDVAERVSIRKMIDRGWPSYDYPSPLADASVKSYRAMLDRRHIPVERLKPGRNDQIVQLRDPQAAKKYPNFEVRNIAANGEVWTGVATNTRQHFPPLQSLQAADYPTENMCSLVIRLSYGKFDYYAGGDIPGRRREGGPPWEDVETPVAQAVGPVEVSVLNHHGNRDSQNAFFLETLRPQVFVIPVWSADHPGHDVLDRIYSPRVYTGARDVFATNMLDANRLVIGDLLDRLKSAQGHIVVRVDPGGDTFRVIILDDSAETYRIKSIHGPYQSR